MILLLSDGDAAIHCAQRAVERAGNDIAPRLNLAEALLAKERVLEAQTEFRRALESEPRNPRAELGIGEVAYKRVELQAVAPHLTHASSSNMARKRSHTLLAQVYRRLGDERASLSRSGVLKDFVAAERELRDAIRLAPQSVEAGYLLGCALQIEKNYTAAAERFRQTLETKPDHALVHYNLAQCLLAEGDRTGAIASLRTALRYAPNQAKAHRDLGKLLARDGKNDVAR